MVSLGNYFVGVANQRLSEHHQSRQHGYREYEADEKPNHSELTIRSRFGWTERLREVIERPLSPQSR